MIETESEDLLTNKDNFKIYIIDLGLAKNHY